MPLNRLVEDKLHRVTMYYPDTDALGIVYHGRYLQYLDQARCEWFATLGYPLPELQANGYLFVVKTISVDYQSPARAGDALEILTEVQNLRRVSVICRQTVHKQAGEEIICQATVHVACVNADMRVQRIPRDLVQKIRGEMNNSGKHIDT